MNTRSKTDKTASASQNRATDSIALGPKGLIGIEGKPELPKYIQSAQRAFAAQAEHSPLPWKESPALLSNTVSIVSTKGLRTEVVSNGLTAANARLIVASVNHAEALAEALRRFVEAYRLESDHDMECAEAIAREALANWEGGQK